MRRVEELGIDAEQARTCVGKAFGHGSKCVPSCASKSYVIRLMKLLVMSPPGVIRMATRVDDDYYHCTEGYQTCVYCECHARVVYH